MPKTFFFYDLETSGLSPRSDRIMQFAGQRTDMKLNKIKDPISVLVKLADDTLPSPEAVVITGITPQQTISEGVSENELCKMLMDEVFTPDTTIVGYNNIRFDDEFIRYLFWRNFYDPYEWSYKDGRSRWDMLDVIRMTRALRPDGISWPVNEKGEPTNKLEQISSINGIDHFKAHDALSDVEALVSVTNLIKNNQPSLFDYLFKMRQKDEIKKLVNLDEKQMFVYSSGGYESQFNKTTVAFPLTTSRNGNVIVYDLRYDPTPFTKMSTKDIKANVFASWEEKSAENFVKLPIKEFQYNHAPAVAPINVLSQNDGWGKIALAPKDVENNRDLLLKSPEFAENIRTVFENREDYPKSLNEEAKLYDSFVPNEDKIRLELVRNASPNDLADLHPNFIDERLSPMLLRYKARNFPRSLSADETEIWDKWRSEKIMFELPDYMSRLNQLATISTDDNEMFLLQELKLWAESIMVAEPF